MKTNPFTRIRLSTLSQSYIWPRNGNEDLKLHGEPDSSFFDITNGFEVLYIINHIGGHGYIFIGNS